MQINRLLSGTVLGVGAIACALASSAAWQQYQRLALSQRAHLRLDTMRAFADIPRTLNVERGFGTAALQTQSPADSAAQGGPTPQQQATEQALAALRGQIASTAGRLDDAAALATVFSEMERTYREMRAVMKARLAEPVDQRGNAIELVTKAASLVNAAAVRAMAEQLRELAALNGAAYRWGSVASTVIDLRDQAGRQAGLLQNFIIDRKPVSPARQIEFWTLQGRVNQVWSRLQELDGHVETPASLKAALSDVQANYVAAFDGIKRDFVPHLDTGAFPLPIEDFRGRATPMWVSPIKLRDAAFEAAASAVRQADSEATTGLVAALAALAGALAISGAALAIVLRRVSQPLTRMTRAISAIGAGDLDTAVPDTRRRDEIGAIAGAVLIFKDNLIHMRRLEEQTAQARLAAEDQRRSTVREMAGAFERAMGGIVGTVSASAVQLQTTAQTMNMSAGLTATRSASVTVAAKEAAANVGSVAAAAEELGASVSEIGRQVAESASLAQAAVTAADHTGGQVQDLAQLVGRIGEVVSMISSIASQTNLLALNATIEAARAGEAGRGFAVVAAEVKDLAGQTAKATEEISAQIQHIQGSTAQAVSAIAGITKRIREIDTVSASIAVAVEEQGAATQEIVRSVAQAAAGAGEVTSNMAGVASSAVETGSAASQVLSSASELSHQSERLSAEVERFLTTVRAA